MKHIDPDAINERHMETLRLIASTNPTEIISLLDLIPIGICITDETGNFIEVNQSYCNFYGYVRKELIGNSFTLVVPKDYREQMQELHNEFMGKKYELQGKWDVVDREGKLRKIISNAAYLPATESHGPCKMTFIAEEDRTDTVLKHLELTVELLKRQLSAQELALQLSHHDLRNNLASILQMLEVLMDKQPSEEQKFWLDLLKERSTHTLDMLKASLGYAQMEQGSYKPQNKVFDLIGTIRDEFNKVQKTKRRKQNTISILYQDEQISSDDTLLIEADQFYIERMFHNLLLNAIEASPENQEVIISIDCDQLLKITIHNRGVVPPEMRDQFFEKFSSSGKKKGTGLGTYIAKQIVEMHQGSIAYRTSEEEGTSVIILFPHSVLQ